jgi:3-oxoacyl-[acyl-carrier protein] reductase
MIVSRSHERLNAAVAGIKSCVPDAVVHAHAADVADPDAVAAMVDAANDAMGGVDILIANAGGPPPGGFATTPLEAYLPALQLNLVSTVAMCNAVVPAMRSRGWGRVVAITSITVREPNPNLILSNTARAGLTGFLRTLAREVAGDGVTVNSLQPGLHRTARLEALYDDLEAVESSIPTGVIGDPDDFGRIAALLCSDTAKFVTGAAIPVDGGASHGLQ